MKIIKLSILSLTTLVASLPGLASAQEYGDETTYELGDQDYDPNDALPADDLPEEDLAQPPAPPAEPQGGVSMQQFDQALSPYGEWLVVPQYGRVWRPYSAVVGADFRPYTTGGRWVYTAHGWTWASRWSWGWAPFHYGRWAHDAFRGWVWVPDTTWGAAWVDWRYGDGYVGWAPLAPVGWRASVNWCFVPAPYFRSASVYRYIVPSHRYRQVYARTAPVYRPYRWGSRSWNAGPSVTYVRGWHRPSGGHRWVHRSYAAPRRAYAPRPSYRQDAPRRYQAPTRYQAPRRYQEAPRRHEQRPTYTSSRPAYPRYQVPSYRERRGNDGNRGGRSFDRGRGNDRGRGGGHHRGR
jgi:hypothetical protein